MLQAQGHGSLFSQALSLILKLVLVVITTELTQMAQCMNHHLNLYTHSPLVHFLQKVLTELTYHRYFKTHVGMKRFPQ